MQGNEGMRILTEELGLVEAERFIVLMRSEPFDCIRRVHTQPFRALKGYVPSENHLTKTTYPAIHGGVVDYTKWRQELFKDVPLDTFLKDAQEYRDKTDR